MTPTGYCILVCAQDVLDAFRRLLQQPRCSGEDSSISCGGGGGGGAVRAGVGLVRLAGVPAVLVLVLVPVLVQAVLDYAADRIN